MKARKRQFKKTLLILIMISCLGWGGFYVAQKYFQKSAPNALTEINDLPQGFVSHGIDVSHYQGNIDWELLFEDQRISFVYCKVTEGVSLIDDKWKSNQNALQEYNVKHGGYHFFIPDLNPIKQAKHFLHQYEPRQNDLPPVIDVELKGISDAELMKDVRTWLNYVENKTGRKPVIYSSYNMYTSLLKDEFHDYKFWIANYADRPDRFQDPKIIHWQYNDHGKVPGIETGVDLNFSKIEYSRD